MTRLHCVICGEPADQFTLHYSADPWDTTPPYTVSLCRDHQAGLIDVVRETVLKMREERNVTA